MMPILCVLISLAPVTEEIRPHDVIRLKNGSTLTGLMRPGAESGAVAITLVNAEGTVTGEVTIQRADILEIVPRRTQQMIYRDEVKRRDLFDPRQTFELAAWCERPAELAGEAIELAHRSLRLDPDNLEVYPLFARLLAALDPSALSAAQRDREVELALRARERSIFLGSAYLRAARILAGDAWTVLAEEAVALLEAVRAQGSEAEQAEATQALAHLYVANDRLDAVLKLLEAAPEALGEKLRAEVVTRLLVRTRPEDLATAHEIVARMPDDADRKVLDASIAWRRGDAARTETLLLAAIEESSSVETARALGVVLALEGKVKTAAEVVKIVAAAGPDGLLLAHLLGEPAKLEELLTAIASAPGAPLLGAAELFRCDEVEQAEERIDEFLAASTDPALRALAWPLAATISFARNRPADACRQLLYARAALPREGRVPLALAGLAAHAGDHARARALFAEAAALGAPEALTTLTDAYLAFRAGELGRAAALAKACAANPTLTEREQRYVARLERAVWEAANLETWADTFDRPDNPEVLNGWQPDAKYGIAVTLAGGNVVMSGVQSGTGDTYLFRFVEGNRLRRAVFSVAPGAAGCQFGVMLTDGKDAVVVGTAPDGSFELVTRRGTAEKREALPAPPGGARRIGLELSAAGDPAALIDDATHASTARQRFSKKGQVRVGFFCRGQAGGAAASVKIESARLWRLADRDAKKGASRGQ